MVQKHVEPHVERRLTEGRETRPGAKIAVVDNVTASGKSAMQVVDAVRNYGAEVVKVVVLVDRTAFF